MYIAYHFVRVTRWFVPDLRFSCVDQDPADDQTDTQTNNHELPYRVELDLVENDEARQNLEDRQKGLVCWRHVDLLVVLNAYV